MMMMDEYHVVEGVTVVAGVFLILGAIFAIINAADIVWRKGYKSMMWIMIPVYIINATYMGPISLYLYFKYGRPAKPGETAKTIGDDQMKHLHHDQHTSSAMPLAAGSAGSAAMTAMSGEHHDHQDHMVHTGHEAHTEHEAHSDHDMEKKEMGPINGDDSNNIHNPHHDASDDLEKAIDPKEHSGHKMSSGNQHHHMDDGINRPFWALVLIGVAHCGSGCVLGDLVGEWIVWGSGATINGHDIWPSLLVDYAFALFFGIFFQYFTIAPMSGDYGVKTLVRAAKADILSLTAFEIGLFGWMIAYQVGIWNYDLAMTTWAYQWQMQIGMFLGFWTSVPVNWYLIKNGIKEPCV